MQKLKLNDLKGFLGDEKICSLLMGGKAEHRQLTSPLLPPSLSSKTAPLSQTESFKEASGGILIQVMQV